MTKRGLNVLNGKWEVEEGTKSGTQNLIRGRRFARARTKDLAVNYEECKVIPSNYVINQTKKEEFETSRRD